MSEYDEIQVSEWLRDGIAAVKAGRRDEARALLMRVVEVNESSEQAWLWLSGVVDADEERLICLENVLTLNPDNVQARAGLKWLQERGATIVPEAQQEGMNDHGPPSRDDDSFMTPDGCVYCGLDIRDTPSHCPHCGGPLSTWQFKRKERSGMAYQLHAFWIILGIINLIEFFFIRFNWTGLVDFTADKAPSGLAPHAGRLLHDLFSLIVRPEATGAAGTEALIACATLLGLAVLGGLAALGLLFRWPQAHKLGLGLIALQLVVEVLLFLRGFPGLLLAGAQGLYTIVLALLMSQTVKDFEQEERREWLEFDRHLANAVDYYSRGRAYEKRGMWAKALLHWQRAAMMNPTSDTYFAALARAYAHLGRYEEALEQVDKALEISRTPEEWRSLREVIVQAQRRAVQG